MQIRRIANQTDAPGLRPHREGQSNPHSPVFSARQATRRILAGTLGPGSTIVGNLTFSESISATIPPDTHIDGSLLMLWMTGVKLGDGCTVSGSVDLSMSEVEHFPRRMVVGGDLFLMGADGFTMDKEVGRPLVLTKPGMADPAGNNFQSQMGLDMD